MLYAKFCKYKIFTFKPIKKVNVYKMTLTLTCAKWFTILSRMERTAPTKVGRYWSVRIINNNIPFYNIRKKMLLTIESNARKLNIYNKKKT